jgi:hypothetical protein
MTPERARGLYNHQSPTGLGSTLAVGDIKKYMTDDEIQHVRAVWQTMSGNSCWADALASIAGINTRIRAPF